MKNKKRSKRKTLPVALEVSSSRAVAIPKRRKDGLMIFTDGDVVLDRIRRHGTKKQVITAVALRRAQEIAINYARKYAPELLPELLSSAKASPLGLPLLRN